MDRPQPRQGGLGITHAILRIARNGVEAGALGNGDIERRGGRKRCGRRVGLGRQISQAGGVATVGLGAKDPGGEAGIQLCLLYTSRCV